MRGVRVQTSTTWLHNPPLRRVKLTPHGTRRHDYDRIAQLIRSILAPKCLRSRMNIRVFKLPVSPILTFRLPFLVMFPCSNMRVIFLLQLYNAYSLQTRHQTSVVTYWSSSTGLPLLPPSPPRFKIDSTAYARQIHPSSKATRFLCRKRDMDVVDSWEVARGRGGKTQGQTASISFRESLSASSLYIRVLTSVIYFSNSHNPRGNATKGTRW